MLNLRNTLPGSSQRRLTHTHWLVKSVWRWKPRSLTSKPGDLESDDKDIAYRPDEFRTGSREFDPKNVGFITEGYGSDDTSNPDGTRFLTMLTGDEARPGNSNAGHQYGKLNYVQRYELVEYMKTL